jgi:hypothetical protein
MLRKLTLEFLDLRFESRDALVRLRGGLWGRLQKQLAQLASVPVEFAPRSWSSVSWLA